MLYYSLSSVSMHHFEPWCDSIFYILQSQEAAKLKPVEKQKERAQEAVKRVEELNDSFSKETEKKLVERLESMEEKKEKQMKALQERLKDHVSSENYQNSCSDGSRFL